MGSIAANIDGGALHIENHRQIPLDEWQKHLGSRGAGDHDVVSCLFLSGYGFDDMC